MATLNGIEVEPAPFDILEEVTFHANPTPMGAPAKGLRQTYRYAPIAWNGQESSLVSTPGTTMYPSSPIKVGETYLPGPAWPEITEEDYLQLQAAHEESMENS